MSTKIPQEILDHGYRQRIIWYPAKTVRPLNYATPDKANWLLAGTSGFARREIQGWVFIIQNPTGWFEKVPSVHAPEGSLEVGEEFFEVSYLVAAHYFAPVEVPA